MGGYRIVEILFIRRKGPWEGGVSVCWILGIKKRGQGDVVKKEMNTIENHPVPSTLHTHLPICFIETYPSYFAG